MEARKCHAKTRFEFSWKNLIKKEKTRNKKGEKDEVIMLDELKNIFANLSGHIDLHYNHSNHEKQTELLELLDLLSRATDKISVSESSEESEAPGFTLIYNQEKTKVSFKGIPGGHEFSSLVLAILHADGKGKFPDEFIIQRIKNLKGPISLKTYISLSCENCPDVVQSLNLMSFLHEDFTHEMVDGEFDLSEIERLKIQGVPSVVDGNSILSVGKTTLIDLLGKLETHYGVRDNRKESIDLGIFDVAIIGGGPAGVSSAIYASRKGLKTILIADKIGGQVQDTKGIENLISVIYTEGPQLAAQLAEHMNAYDIKILEHRKVESVSIEKVIKLESGEFLQARSVIVATGAKWRELGIPGEKEYRGRGVAFCPHCDGPYYKNKDIAVVGGGNSGVEAAIDLAGIVKSVTLLEFMPELKADSVLVEKLKSLSNVKILKC
jgi:NADH-dependent peroxiredoxin subunit F